MSVEEFRQQFADAAGINEQPPQHGGAREDVGKTSEE